MDYSKTDKMNILNFCNDQAFDKYRKDFWMIASKAKREKKGNEGYYSKILNNYPEYITSIYEQTILNDLNRTFPTEDFYKHQENLNRIKNILIAYSRRNPHIGYIQGFNFMIGRLLETLGDEEDTFWVFAQIIENILPVEYYDQLCGVMTDCAIISEKVETEFPELHSYLKSKGIDIFINNLIFKWLMSLFMENMEKSIYLHILDAFFLLGDRILYKASLLILSLLKKKIMDIANVDELCDFFSEGIRSFTHPDFSSLLFNFSVFKLHKEDIIEFRKEKSKKIVSSIKKLKITERNLNNKVDIENCNLDWPYCLKEIGEKNINHVMKFSLIEKPIIENDYFTISHNIDKLNQTALTQNKQIENEYKGNKEKYNIYTYSNLLMNRCVHKCNSKLSSRHVIMGNVERRSSLMKKFFDDQDSKKLNVDSKIKNNKSNDLINYFKDKNETDAMNRTTIIESMINRQDSDSDVSVNKSFYDKWLDFKGSNEEEGEEEQKNKKD